MDEQQDLLKEMCYLGYDFRRVGCNVLFENHSRDRIGAHLVQNIAEVRGE